ncbi:hypothetical protein [Ectobacillus panaciterrae]|uniref:hypothetical protein n=1 Tax=Ectobacillus panaciterrae TaxID=363872 RepID=UPI0004249776|nr:hypothetical protein [Ectobacillus panaciterrae]
MIKIYQAHEFMSELKELQYQEALTKNDLLHPRFLLDTHHALEMYYAPFDYINTKAKIMIIGITPGWTQMQLAFTTVLKALKQGESLETGVKRVKQQASFAGSMRSNLTSMLNELQLPHYLGISDSASLFAEHRHLLHPCSMLRYPVFLRAQNYTGHTPQMAKSPFLMEWIRSVFVPELHSVHPLLIIPLGKAVSDTLKVLADEYRIDEERCLLGFPHPSGANGHRHAQFETGKQEFLRKIQFAFS